MANFSTPFAANGSRRFPTNDELQNGFPCGPADRELFNALFWQIQSEVHSVVAEAGLTPNNSQNDWLLQAIEALISSATGGNPAGYVLMSQAQARLPIHPEVNNLDGRITVTSPGVGTARLPGGVDFLHRGIFAVTTAQTDFATEASKIYHLRWNPVDGYSLEDLADTGYNPTAMPETSRVFDSAFDDMLIARIVTNSSNVLTITNLANKNDLYLNKFISGTDGKFTGADGANFLFTDTYDWARTPNTSMLAPVKVATGSTFIDLDQNTFDPALVNRNDAVAVTGTTASLPTSRYRLNAGMLYDGAQSITSLFSIRA